MSHGHGPSIGVGAVTKKPNLAEHDLLVTTDLAKPSKEHGVAILLPGVTLAGGQFVRSHHGGVKPLGHPSSGQCRQCPHGVEAESASRNGEVGHATFFNRERRTEACRFAGGQHDSSTGGRGRGEETIGNAQRDLTGTGPLDDGPHTVQDNVFATNESTRRADRQDEQTKSHRFGEGTKKNEGLEEFEVATNHTAVVALAFEFGEPQSEESFH